MSSSVQLQIQTDIPQKTKKRKKEHKDKSKKKRKHEKQKLALSSELFGPNDFAHIELKSDHEQRPIWVLPNKHIFLETFSPIYIQAYDFLVAIAEPVSRPEFIHEYVLTEYSLYAAVSIGLETEQIIKVLDKLSKVELSQEVVDFIRNCTASYGKVKLVLQKNKFYVESPFPDVLMRLLKDKEIAMAKVDPDPNSGEPIDPATGLLIHTEDEEFEDQITKLKKNKEEKSVVIIDNSSSAPIEQPTEENNTEDFVSQAQGQKKSGSKILAFEIKTHLVENVKKRCIELDYPMLEEYDFRNDTINPSMEIDLKPATSIRSYQEKSLSKMFGNGRARSGIIVLPCGAGKTLVGITAACTIKKSTLVLCTSAVSVEQWYNQFRLWSNISQDKMVKFTSVRKEKLPKDACCVFTTYNMLTFSGSRSTESKEVMEELQNREWGLMLLDEVHVVPAEMFRKVIMLAKSHCKLGLTATLLREDDKTDDLYFLIGPKLYEANWLDLQEAGYLATVQCVEVWCPMTPEFYREYLQATPAKKKLLYVMNPNKFRACEFLIRYHEQRGDKIIVFSDNVFALEEYAKALNCPYIYGPTTQTERMNILSQFQHNSKLNTIFISKVGDTSIDLPDANVIIQISSHFGSRRQEAQRLGRILRPKTTEKKGFDAFFYSLVSQDTLEMYYSTKRQQFLINQGYSFRVLNNIHELVKQDTSGTLVCFRTKQEELNLLAKVRAAEDSKAQTERVGTEDDIGNGAVTSRRSRSSLKVLSGAGNTYYQERRGKKKQNGTTGQTSKAYASRHPLFRKLYKK